MLQTMGSIAVNVSRCFALWQALDGAVFYKQKIKVFKNSRL